MAFARVEGTVGGDAGGLLPGRDPIQPLGQPSASWMPLVVTSTARMSIVGQTVPWTA
jgi:hypothetical protein